VPPLSSARLDIVSQAHAANLLALHHHLVVFLEAKEVDVQEITLRPCLRPEGFKMLHLDEQKQKEISFSNEDPLR